MITYKGRVVYERIKHTMTEKDAARILAALIKDQSPRELAKTLWGFDMHIVKLQVIDDEAIWEFVVEFLSLVIKWFGSGLAWLTDFIVGVVSGDAPPQPDVSEEMKDG